MSLRRSSIRLTNWFISRPRTIKRGFILTADFVAIVLALWLAFSLRFSTLYQPSSEQWWLFLLAPIVAIPIFIRFGLYRAIIRYIGFKAIWAVVQAVTLYTLIFAVILLLMGSDFTGIVPRTVYPIYVMLLLVFIGGSRLVVRWWLVQENFFNTSVEVKHQIKPVLVYGAGNAGTQLVMGLKVAESFRPIAFIDDNSGIQGQQIAGLVVHPFTDLSRLISKYAIEEVLLAIPSATRRRRNKIIQQLEPYPVHVKTLPGLNDLAEGKISITDVQEVEIADLLGRDQVRPIPHLLKANIEHKVVMITGAGGSIGSELSRQIAGLKPKALVLFEQSEYNLYRISNELTAHKLAADIKIYSILGTVVDQNRVAAICRRFQVNTIYHAAAYKHVPIVEHNISQGIHNNIFGTLSCAQAAIDCQVDTFVLVSTDKAVRPTNIMGASKRLAESILQALAHDAEVSKQTRFTMVRFGNVLDSSGSVVPLFRQQILNGGPVTVTDPNIIRYFMTIPEAAELVIQAGAMGQGGDVFVLDMGEPVKILDMAKRMIHLSGHQERDEDNPEGDIEISYTGLRPGEKLYEELLIGENVSKTDHQKIMRAEELVIPWAELKPILALLREQCENHDYHGLKRTLETHVYGFQHQGKIEDWLAEQPAQNPRDSVVAFKIK